MPEAKGGSSKVSVLVRSHQSRICAQVSWQSQPDQRLNRRFLEKIERGISI